MWRESRRCVVVVVVALATAACTNAEADSTSTASETSTAPAVGITTTTVPPTTTTTSETMTTTAAFTEAVGSPDLLAGELKIARDFIRLSVGDEAAASIPEPDLTNPDPLVALRELLLFELDVLQIGSVQQFAEILAVRDSPAYGSLRRNLDTFSGAGLKIVLRGQYQILAVELLSRTDLESIAGAPIVRGAPDGSAYVAYETSNGPYDVVRQDGSLFQEESGWDPRRRAAILAPTESGWKYYWDESQ